MSGSINFRSSSGEIKAGKSGELLDGLFDWINDLRDALALAASGMTSDSAYRVETTSRLAQWRIDNLASSTFRKSDPFKIGNWNWHLAVEKNRGLAVKLFPEASSLARENPPIASFVIRVLCSAAERKALYHPEVKEKLIKNSEEFVWPIESPLSGKLVIDVEFLDLKIASPTGGDPVSIWGDSLFPRHQTNTSALSALSRMLSNSVLTDIVINASDGGALKAHRAILASRSPVFRSMFSHDLIEKELSVVTISDMSLEACQAFLSYLYGGILPEDFLAHRLALLGASDKYDVADLKEACHVSLLEDIDTKNVLERLQTAHLYGLEALKQESMRYLVKFGKICDIMDEFGAFLQCADRELISEVFKEILAAWKGF